MNRTYRRRHWQSTITRATLAVLACAGAASAQIVDNKVPLNYNFHGMVHSTEWGSESAAPWNNADSPSNLYRSIADRGLPFNASDVHAIGSYPLIGATGMVYELFDLRGYANTTAANALTNGLDIIHLGSRGVYYFPWELGARPSTAAGAAPAWAPFVSITALSGDGSAVTATTSADHGLVVGDQVDIVGASVGGYNGRQTVTGVPTSTTFTYANTSTAATVGSIFCNNPRVLVTALSGDGATVSGTTNVAHGMAIGNPVIISGSSINDFNGTWTVATVPTTTTFTFAHTTAGAATGTGIIAGTAVNTADQVTTLSTPITVDANTEIGVLYMISNGGGLPTQFDCVLTFNNGVSDTNVTVRLSANDWFNNAADPTIISPPLVTSQKKLTHTDAGTTYTTFRGARNEDNASLDVPGTTFSTTNGGQNLNVTEAIISVPAIIAAGTNVAGQNLTKVTFRNPTFPSATITTLTGNGTTATATITSNNGFVIGQPIEVRGANVAGLNGSYTVTGLVGTTQVQYANATVAASTTAQSYVQSSTVTTTPSGTPTLSGGIVTMTTAAAHGLAVGDYVKLSGFSTASQNGSFRVLSVPSATSFTYVGSSTSTLGQRQLVRPGVDRGYSIYAVTARTGSPANATCGGALLVSAGSTVGSNPHTINASSASSCGGGNDTTSVWYAYSSPTGGMVEVRTCDTVASFDTTLAVYSDCSGTQVVGACNDNTCGTGSRVRWTAAAGVPYYIRVAGVNNASGTFTLTLADPAPVDITMPLQFNWNGICHGATEQTIPDATGATHENRSDLNGFRAIADRGLLCDGSPGSLNAGGNSTIGAQGIEYIIYGTTLQADMVHLGNRNVVANGARTFSPPGTTWPAQGGTSTSNNGLSPLWLNNVDQTTPQTSSMTGLNAVMGPKTRIGLLYHASDVTVGNFAKFDVKLDFSDSTSVVVTVMATDWFWNNTGVLPPPTLASGLEVQRVLGIYRATQNTDKGTDTGAVQSGGWLKVDEAVISRDSLVNAGLLDINGKTLTAITFQNPIAGSGTPAQVTTNSAFAIYSATLRDPASFNLNFGPAAVGTVTPNNLVAGSSGKMTVTVSRGSGSPNNITTVVVDATAIGLSSTLALNDSGTGGDMSPNDNIWSTNVAFPVNAVPQAYSLPYTVTDAQARTASGNIIFSVVPPSGLATPTPAIAGSSPVLTVTMSNNGAATPGISTISVDASALGAGTVSLLDNGQSANGDAVANNGIYSGKLALPITTPAATYSLPFTVTDTSSNIYQGLISLAVTDPTTALSVASVVVGSEPRFSITLSNSGQPTPNISSVTVDASGLGLSSSLALNDAGTGGDLTASDGIYSASVRVPLLAAPATYTLPYVITDTGAQQRFGNLPNLTVNAPIVAFTPTGAIPGGTSKLTISLTRGGLTSTLITSVVADMSSIGLSNSVALNDAGTDGDATAADGIYSIDFTIPGAQAQGVFSIGWAVNDSTPAQLTGAANFTVIGPPTATNIGTFSACGTSVSGTLSAANEVIWYKFTLTGAGIDRALGTYLDIDTEGSLLTTLNDTELSLYDSNGALIANDDDDGSGNLSQLTFGADVPARGAINGSAAYNGRDGATLPAGTYYLAISGFNTTANPLWQAVSASAYVGPYTIRFASGNVNGAVSGTPATYIDLGQLNATDTRSNTAGVVPIGGIQWYRFEVLNAVNGANPTRTFIDIDTNGSALADTGITLFRDDGTGALVAVDNDSGSDAHSQLSFGRGSRPAPGNGLPFNAQNGTTLAAGVYFLAVTDGPSAAASNFTFFCLAGTNTGGVSLHIRTGVQSRVLAGPIINPANNHRYYLLDTSFSWTNNEAYAIANLRGHLATISDASENEWVRVNVLRWPDGNTDRRGFIGYYDPTLTNNPGNTAGLFVWASGEANAFEAWSAGEPNNGLGGTEHYTEMLSANGLWNDVVDAGITAGNFAVVEAGCPGDFNLDGIVSIDDLFLYFNAYFTGVPAADMNNDGLVSIDDLFLYINFYFSC